MQMHLSIEEEGKKNVGSKEEFSLASSKCKSFTAICIPLSLWLILLVLF
jgi:hypothetical protein